MRTQVKVQRHTRTAMAERWESLIPAAAIAPFKIYRETHSVMVPSMVLAKQLMPLALHVFRV